MSSRFDLPNFNFECHQHSVSQWRNRRRNPTFASLSTTPSHLHRLNKKLRHSSLSHKPQPHDNMLVKYLAFLLAAGYVEAFVPASPRSSRATRSSSLLSTIEKDPPVKTAPGAGWEPEWEGREGLSPEEFMESDLSKPDLAGMWECPLTRWDSEG